ncbi:MFS transporter [Saccharicrinis sp. FJH54]|uniref:MFS transporter n=1 Tax=Saccharicrinis sp. FJH54 TaxID=3344665 RepID=UPI0035D4E640
MLTFPVSKQKSIRIPALSESAVLRYLSFASLYFAQGIPNGLLWFALPAWLAMNGKSALEIGSFIAVIGLPWSFKIIAAPLMDRFTFLPMGRRKPWLLFGQFGLALSFLGMSLVSDPLTNLNPLMIMGFLSSLFSIFQDIAVDGLAIDILPAKQQARANGLMWGSKILGSSATVATTSLLFNHFGYTGTMVLFAAVVILIMLIPLCLKERPGEKLLPWSKGESAPESLNIQLHSWKKIFKSLFGVFFLPVSLFMGMAAFCFSTGRGLIDAILPVFTVQELGWTDTMYSQTFAFATLISGILGMFVGGALIDFFGKIRMSVIYILSITAIILLMSFGHSWWKERSFVTGFFIAFYTLDAFLTITVFAIAMHLCWKRISATQFTLYMAVSNLGLTCGAWLMGQLRNQFEWQYVILAYLVFIIFMLFMMKFINFEKHKLQVQKLENAEINNGN